jgi:hypothetical protein
MSSIVNASSFDVSDQFECIMAWPGFGCAVMLLFSKYYGGLLTDRFDLRSSRLTRSSIKIREISISVVVSKSCNMS